MGKTIYEPRPRYVVEWGRYVETLTGQVMPSGWEFRRAFASLDDARAFADLEAGEHLFVRVVDREADG